MDEKRIPHWKPKLGNAHPRRGEIKTGIFRAIIRSVVTCVTSFKGKEKRKKEEARQVKLEPWPPEN